MYISAGHGGGDKGAVGFGLAECDIAREFRNIVSFYLMRDKVKHELDGGGTDNLPLREVIKRTKVHKGLEVEFHCNAGPPAATGCEVLCAPKDNVVADKICKALSEQLQIRNRGVKPENAGQHSRLAFVQAGGMIVELFFISNEKDLAAYQARKWLAGRAVAAILKEHAS